MSAPDSLPLRRDLAVHLEWNGQESLHAYATNLAHLNNVSLTRLLGRHFDPREWRAGSSRVLQRLAVVSRLPMTSLSQPVARLRYPTLVVEDSIVGLLEPRGHDCRVLLDVLPPKDFRTTVIRRDLSRLDTPRVRGRLCMLARLGEIVLPRLTLQWPPQRRLADEDRLQALLHDSTRWRPPPEWSLTAREYVALTLWEHTRLGAGRTPSPSEMATDLLLIDEITNATTELRATAPELATALQRLAGVMLNPIDEVSRWRPASTPAEPPGPFTLFRLRDWTHSAIEIVHLADEVATLAYLDEHDHHPDLADYARIWRRQPWESTPRIDRFVTHLALRPAAEAVIQATADLATQSRPPLNGHLIWTHRRAVSRMAAAHGRPLALDPQMSIAFVWIHLTGHIPPWWSLSIRPLQEQLERVDLVTLAAHAEGVLHMLTDPGVPERDQQVPRDTRRLA